jgi:hypothetical protein
VTLGTGVVWLSPGVPRSVAPKGIPEPTTDDDPDIALPAPDIVAAPDAPVFEVLEPQLFDWADPPPSNVAFELILGHGMISGLTPGVLISVEPSGMPPRPDELELSEELAVDGALSGEVGPMPGVGLVCACAATTPIQPIAAMKNGYRIELPQFVVEVSLTRCCKARKSSALAGIEYRRSLGQNPAAASWFRRAKRGFVTLQAADRRRSRFHPDSRAFSAATRNAFEDRP